MILGNLASAIFSLYIIQSYFNIYLIKTEKKLYLYLSSLLYVLFKCSCMIVDLRSTVCLVLLNVFFVFIISIGSYCGEIRNKFILTALLLIAWMIAEVIVGYILSLNQIDYRDNEFVGAIISEIFIFVIVMLLLLWVMEIFRLAKSKAFGSYLFFASTMIGWILCKLSTISSK